MRKMYLLLIVCFFNIFPLLAQKGFDKGYYVDYTGKRVEGFLRTSDFDKINNANSQFDFMSSPESSVVSVPTSQFSEVGIGTDIKFQRFTVQLDDSNLLFSYNYTISPDYKTATLFLNVLTEGAASLYSYQNIRGTKYFYKSEASPFVKQLFYKN